MNIFRELSSSDPEVASGALPMEEPFLIRGGCASWPAFEALTFDSLRAIAGEVQVEAAQPKAGGQRRRMRLGEYLDYCQTSDEAEPLYLMDWRYQNSHAEFRDLMKPPAAFENWLDLLPENQRPPWSWAYIGPKHSGSPMHLDARMSSAWNAVLSGCKEWVVYRPDHPISHALRNRQEISADAEVRDDAWTCVQHAGDLIYIPGGWAHSVHNREAGIAFTENFINGSNYELVMRVMEEEGDRAFCTLLRSVRAMNALRAQENRET